MSKEAPGLGNMTLTDYQPREPLQILVAIPTISASIGRHSQPCWKNASGLHVKNGTRENFLQAEVSMFPLALPHPHPLLFG